MFPPEFSKKLSVEPKVVNRKITVATELNGQVNDAPISFGGLFVCLGFIVLEGVPSMYSSGIRL